MNNLLITPAVVFLIILFTCMVLIFLAGRLSFRVKKHTAGETKSYACGEDTYNNKAQPDYSNFFSFAFFFTLAHVATLMITTVPAETLSSLGLAAIYIAAGAAGLHMLFRKA